MAILLHSTHKIGSISLHADRISGIQVPARVYKIVDHVMRLDGYADDVLWHDVEELIASHGSIYRHMTAAEQSVYAEAQRRKKTIEE